MKATVLKIAVAAGLMAGAATGVLETGLGCAAETCAEAT